MKTALLEALTETRHSILQYTAGFGVGEETTPPK